MILLNDQDRSLWNRDQIAEGSALVNKSARVAACRSLHVQAAIAAVHADAASADATDWGEIAGLYDVLLQIEPSPVVELNRAVAIAMRDGPASGLALIEAILARGDLKGYHLAHAARADLCRRLGKITQARAAYKRAIALAARNPSAGSSSVGWPSCRTEPPLGGTDRRGRERSCRFKLGRVSISSLPIRLVDEAQ